MRKTKIVATLGPSTDNPDVLRAMLNAGMDVARFNFSHGSHEEHKGRVEMLRNLCNEMGLTVAMLADTQGPEIRLGKFKDGRVELSPGDVFTLTTDNITGDSARSSVTYPGLSSEVAPGNRILLDDGLIELVVESVYGADITTRVINGGELSDRKGLNVPGVKLSLPYISGKDRADLRFIVENGFDLVAASFVRSKEDIREIRDILHRVDSKNKIRIISKIESAEGVRNIEEIITASDGIMVARGDLGVEMAYEEIPILQKKMIRETYGQAKEVITATQMLESMIKNPRPTRAEVSDVANAIYDSTSAIMLSGETAMGKYPVEAINVMARVTKRVEANIDYRERFQLNIYQPEPSITNAISHATVTTAHTLGAAAILTVSLSGRTARNVAKFRPNCPIIACTPDPVAHRQLKLTWGITPLLTKTETDTNALFSHAVNAALEKGYVKNGDIVVITAGVPVGHSGTTNILKVHEVGDKMIDKVIVL